MATMVTVLSPPVRGFRLDERAIPSANHRGQIQLTRPGSPARQLQRAAPPAQALTRQLQRSVTLAENSSGAPQLSADLGAKHREKSQPL